MSELIDDFTAGDLLYGETYDRKNYLVDFDRKFALPGSKAMVTIDRLTNSCALEKGLKKGEPWSDSYTQDTDVLPADAQTFYEYAQKSRFAQKMQGINTTDKTKTGVAKGASLTKPFLRSKCKAGIEFVIAQGFTVRFVLDSLTEERLRKIGGKELEQPWYTGSELRSIYRNRAKYGNKVVFYRFGSRCKTAPWDEFPGAFG